MLTLIAFAVLFGYIWRTRRDLEVALDIMSRRVQSLESERSVTPRTAPEPIEPVALVPPSRPLVPLAPRVYPADTPAVAPLQTTPPVSLESEIGARWLLYVGIFALVVGVSYFQKLAIDNGWIGERARVIEGLVAGVLLVGTGRWFVRRGYTLYGQIVAGGGVAVLYVSIFAASTLYALVSRPVAFAAFSMVTVLAAWLADRYRSQGLAVIAVGGGFLTPFLLPSEQDAQVALFTYDALLVAGTMALAYRRVWPLLNVVSYVLTTMTLFTWALAFYEQSNYLVTELYLTLFCAMFLYILARVRSSSTPAAQVAQAVLWTAPVAYYAASLAVLGPHSIPLLVFLGILAAVGSALAPRGHAVARLLVWLAVAVPLLAWISTHSDRTWLVSGLIAIAGIYAVNLLAHLHGMLDDTELAETDIALLHLNPLVLYTAAHWLVGSVNPGATSVLALLCAVWNGTIAVALRGRRRQYALHFAAVAATLLAVAIGVEFDGEARTIGWAAEGAAIVWLGMHQQRRWFHVGGLLVFAVAVLQFAALLPERAPVDYRVILNWRAACGALVICLTYVLAWLHRGVPLGGRSAVAPFVVIANVLTLALLTAEVVAYWQVRTFLDPDTDSRLGRELMLSIGWALYATALIVIGLRYRYAPIRYLAMAVFALTTLKVFFFDLAELDRIYRVSSIIGLGVLLLVTSYLYHRSRRVATEPRSLATKDTKITKT